MRINFNGERILAVVAHPDDVEVLCAGTMARATEEGAVVAAMMLCDGDKGQPDPPIEQLAQLRREEATRSASLIGYDVLFGGFPDGELFDSAHTRAELLRAVRSFQPTLVLAHAGSDYHPDHRAASAIAESVSWFCASRGHSGGAPLRKPPALWWMDTFEMIDFNPSLFIDISGQVDLKRRMLRCHETQLRRGNDGDFSPLEELMLRQAATRGAQSGVTDAEAFRPHHAWKRARAW